MNVDSTAAAAKNGARPFAHTDVMKIQGAEIEIRYEEIDQSRLRFYAENPRIYSLMRKDGKEPKQEDIERQLIGMEHVKHLIRDIKQHGALLEPVFVKSGTYDVLEGNSRLAAYRALAKQDPIKWAKMRCIVLPANVPESLTFSLLAQLHLKGKKEWVPFEQAGYLYRRYYDQKIDLPTLATESNLSQQRVRQLIETYDFMRRWGENDIGKWSYYEEFLKSRVAQKTKEKYPSFEETVVRIIQNDPKVKAVDIRDKLSKICAAPTRTVRRFAEGEISFLKAYESALDAGVDNNAYRRINRFRHWLAEGDTAKSLLDSEAEADKIVFELGKIRSRVVQLEQMFAKRRGRS